MTRFTFFNNTYFNIVGNRMHVTPFGSYLCLHCRLVQAPPCCSSPSRSIWWWIFYIVGIYRHPKIINMSISWSKIKKTLLGDDSKTKIKLYKNKIFSKFFSVLESTKLSPGPSTPAPLEINLFLYNFIFVLESSPNVFDLASGDIHVDYFGMP